MTNNEPFGTQIPAPSSSTNTVRDPRFVAHPAGAQTRQPDARPLAQPSVGSQPQPQPQRPSNAGTSASAAPLPGWPQFAAGTLPVDARPVPQRTMTRPADFTGSPQEFEAFAPDPFTPPYPVEQPPPGAVPSPRRRLPKLRNEQIVAALLAAAGVAVTLIGVVLLLVMAAREGFLTRPVRVGGGAAIASALAGAALWVRPRVGGRIGSVALMTTAASAAFFDVLAVTRFYAWVPLGVGLAAAGVIALAVGLKAMSWDERWLFSAVTAGVALFAPFLTGGDTGVLVAFLLVVQVAGLAPEFLKGWDEVSLVRTVPVVVAALGWAAHTGGIIAGAACGAVALVGLLSIVLSSTRTAQRVIPAEIAPIAFVASWAPVWVFAVTSERMTWALVAGVLTLVAAGAQWVLRQASPMTGVAAVIVLVVSALEFVVAAATGSWIAVPFFVAALVALGVQRSTRVSVWGQIGMGMLVAGVIVHQFVAPWIDLFYRSRAADMPSSAIVSGFLLLAIAAVAAWSVRGTAMTTTHVQMCLLGAGAAGLLGFSLTTIGLLGRTETGFFLVHLVITVAALAVAAAVLTAGLRRPRHLGASMGWGLALVGCALVKLFAFDLHYMGSMTKALTFVVAGIVLLAAGTVYARTYGEVSKARAEREPVAYGPHPMGL